MFMLSKIVKLLKAFNANVNPGEIAHALAFGVLLGFLPKDNILWYLIFIFVLFIRINKPMYLLMTLLFSALAAAFDPMFDSIGCWICQIECVREAGIALYQIPFMAFTHLGNSVVMGALVCGIVLYLPMYGLGRLIVFLWRKYLTPVMRNGRVFKAISGIPVIAKIISAAGDN